ncbi:MAG: YafY family transcriptional regulator [Lachnospiraceae bacterium]|nr:YafY family transcriptional regulator [Lachnospiraceae bacterium]
MLNRLLGIIYILMNKGTVTAGELAERFEVSVRTIYRDVETLSMAGIPIYARKGKNGGISLTERFVLDKMLVSEKEQTEILAALTGLQETGAQNDRETLRKLGEFFKTEPMQWVSIDLSDWSGRRQELYGQLKEAVLNKKKIRFDYYGQYGEMTSRQVCPAQLLFKEYTWYLRAFCESRQAMRLFKVLRMKRVEVLEETFDAVDAGEEERVIGNDKVKGVNAEISLLIDKKEAYRVYDRFEEEDITVLENGDFSVKARYLIDDWVYGMILSFGPAARVLEPAFVREEIKSRLKEMQEIYENEGNG